MSYRLENSNFLVVRVSDPRRVPATADEATAILENACQSLPTEQAEHVN